jgi:DtxR family Mn-dependent transcriptional regulator
MPSPAIENYLKTMYAVERAGEKITTSALAARLGIQPASVTGMVKRLADMALVSYTPYGAAALTAEGRRAALAVIRNHRLIERFLVDTLSVPWDEVHDEAHKLEHALSDALVDRIEAFLGHPDTCPHGSPIPTADGEIAAPIQILLADLSLGQAAVVSEVDDDDAAFLRYLGELGLVPGAEVKPLGMAPFDGPITLRISDQERSVGASVTNRVWVRSAEPAEIELDAIARKESR